VSRAARRREEKPTAVAAAAAATAPFPVLDWLWWAILAAVIFMTGRATVHRITWYLAVDQFGYLTFAGDLLQGRIFHEWSVAKALAPVLPPQTDMLAQTYIWDAGRLYCRYAPGFPIVLAAWMGLFGKFAAHYLNPTLYLVFIAVYATTAARMLGDRWRALVAVGLLLLVPTYTHLWALTVTRDLCAHLFAWTAFLCVIPPAGRALTLTRVASAGLALGMCSCIRPDDIMYALPVFLLAVVRWREDGTTRAVVQRSVVVGGAMVVVGLLPFFGYNWIATGNPLRPTQGMELNMILRPAGEVKSDRTAPPPPATPASKDTKVGFPSPGWRGGTAEQVQGGGLRLANLPKTLPGLFALLNRGYSAAFLGLGVWGVVLAILQRPLVLLSAVPYTVSALLLYGCWTKPDSRYVLGVHYFMPLLIAEGMFGTFDLRRFLPAKAATAEMAWSAVAAVGVLLFVGMALFTPVPPGYQNSPLPVLLSRVVLPGVALGFLGAMVWPARMTGSVVAGVIGAVLAGYVVQQASVVVARPQAGFQRREMERARATLQSKLPRNAVVVSAEDIGRPAENIQFYSEVAQSFYWTDIARWRVPLPILTDALAKAGLQLYWLEQTPKTEGDRRVHALASIGVKLEKIAEIPPTQAMDWFVAAAFHRGVQMDLHKVTVAK
jgi:hypothetical protein